MGDAFTDAIKRALADNPKRAINDPALTPAGVMLIVYRKDGKHRLLLQKRTDKVDDHKGEVSFPGGRMDPEDNTLLDTALRETREEMGIKPQDIRVLGALDDAPTTSHYRIAPFVGALPYPYDFAPSETEVAAILEPPIDHLMDVANRRDEIRVVRGDLDRAPAFAYDGHIIFGATARILDGFLRLLPNPS